MLAEMEKCVIPGQELIVLTSRQLQTTRRLHQAAGSIQSLVKPDEQMCNHVLKYTNNKNDLFLSEEVILESVQERNQLE